MICKRALVVAFLFTLLASAPVAATDSIKEIKRAPVEHQLVEVVGRVTLLIEPQPNRANFYFLRDDFGGTIKIRSSESLPEVGDHLQVNGRVSIIFTPDREVIIDETNRRVLDPPSAGPQSDSIPAPGSSTVQPSQQPPAAESAPAEEAIVEEPAEVEPPTDYTLYFLIGGIGLVFIIIVVLVIIMLKGKNAPASTPEFMHATPAPAPSGNTAAMPAAGLTEKFEPVLGKTIKLNMPPAGTLKMLPGHLQVLEGEDKIKEVRFFLPRGTVNTEFTFGRGAGPSTGHIQLSHGTVSVNQAKIIFADNSYRLINYSSTNNTRVNDRVMGENESVQLNDGDMIQMGIVKFQYRAN